LTAFGVVPTVIEIVSLNDFSAVCWTHFCITDVTEAFLNDPYDWEGPKHTYICATEADMDGALTMQLLKLQSGGRSERSRLQEEA
jgi:L-fucose isomerase-like protein